MGALHGPAELLPISSSAHLTIVPWLLGWSYPGLAEGRRKEFEVAVHAGTAAALLIALRSEVAGAARRLDRRRVVQLAISALPAALTGLALEGPIERRLGSPRPIALGLTVGSALMLAADRRPQARHCEEADELDAVWLGLAQTLALAPGISRSGVTLAAARWRRFRRADAARLSRAAGVPVLAGAALLKGYRLHTRQIEPGMGSALAGGAAAAFLSTLAGARLITPIQSDGPLLPYALYRAGLAAAILHRLRSCGPVRSAARARRSRRARR